MILTPGWHLITIKSLEIILIVSAVRVLQAHNSIITLQQRHLVII